MNEKERNELVKFCIMAKAELEGIKCMDVDSDKFINMTDEELEEEADWLDNLLGK